MAAELKPIDVICQPSRDGKITPMKIRVIDEDGEYQEYKIKGYNIIMRNNIGLNKKRILAARYATRPFSSAKAAEAGRHMHKDSSITPGIRITVYTGIYILCHMSICKQDKGISKVR